MSTEARHCTMFKDCFGRKRSKKKKEANASSSAVHESVSIHANPSIPVPSSAVGSQISANSKLRSPSPKSQSNVPALTQSGGVVTDVIEIGSNADFAGATGIAIGTNNSVNVYNIRLGNQELTKTQVEEFVAGLVAFPGKMEELVSLQSRINLPRAMAAHNDFKTQKVLRPCCQGTREAVLKEIANWFIVRGTSQIYVLSGLAGIGKSTIAYTVAQRAHRLGLLGASFFFSRTDPERRTAEIFFTTIAFQLCVYDDEFSRAIRRVLDTNQGEDATTKDPKTQLNVLIIEPLRDLVRSRTQPVIIVVDALDECEDKDAQVILKALDELVHKIPSFKILLTSRPQPHLNHLLDSHDVLYLHYIEYEIINNDIRRYLKFSLSQEQVKSILPTLRTPWGAIDDDIDALVQAAGTLFIVASTSVLLILDKTVLNPASQMKKLRSELPRNRTPFVALGDFYSIILRTVVPPGSDHVLVRRFQKVVGTIALLYDPLPVVALAPLIDLEEDDIYGVLDNMQAVIFLGPDNIPYIFHKSFSDWIMDTERCKPGDKVYRIDPRECHTWLTTRCFQTMNERLKRNILNIDGVTQFITASEGLKQKRIWKEMLEKISPVLIYACIYWTMHLTEANIDDADLIHKLKIFADEHLLHWIEGTGWMSRVISFNLDYNYVHTFMEKTTLQNLCELFYDTYRFISNFWSPIRISPLFTYHSALPFIPTRSLFYQRYNREMMDNLCRVDGGPKRWGTVVNSAIHGQHVTFIEHQRHSGGFASCSTTRVMFWSDMTCTPIAILIDCDRIALANNSCIAVARQNMISVLEFPDLSCVASVVVTVPILSIALSSNCRRLAAALYNGSVTLWVLVESKQIAEFDGFGSDGHSSHHLGFSPNGDCIAFRLAGGGFALRNAINGEYIANLNHNSAMVHCLLFSPDGSQLASLFVEDDDKYTLTLWDYTDRKSLGAVRDIGSELAFSADGSLIGTGGWNNALKLWSGNNEDQDLHFIETPDLGSLESVSCLAFSKDGILAIGSAGTEIILYDVAKRSFITTIPIRKPTAIAFSSDCTRLFIGNADGDVRLLDVPAIRASAQTSQENSAPVSALVFSPDCSRLISGSEDGIIRIWNTSCASEPIATCEGHSSKITTIAFMPSGGQFVSGDVNGTIKLWSNDDCALSGTVRWPISGELTSVAVSKNLLAAATKDSIALWDLQGSRMIDRLGDCGSTLLSLSNQDENLLLASFDGDSNTVTVWDVGNRTRSATFSIGSIVERMVFYDDDSNIFTFLHGGGGSEIRLYPIVDVGSPNEVSISDPVDHGVVPTWKGIPVWMFYSNNLYIIRGWFSEGDGNYATETICRLPTDFDVVKVAYGSSMFALLCRDGCLLLLQSN